MEVEDSVRAAGSNTIDTFNRTFQMNHIPDPLLLELDQLFLGLANTMSLLREGRRYGVRIGLTQASIDAIRLRHGDAAKAVLANCVVIAAEQHGSDHDV